MGEVTVNDSEDVLLELVRSTLRNEIESARARAATARRGLGVLSKRKNSNQLTYKVALVSLWQDHGEKMVTITREGPLAELLTEAISEFLKVNKRSDVQAEYFVYVVLKSKGMALFNIPIPESYWSEHKWK